MFHVVHPSPLDFPAPRCSLNAAAVNCLLDEVLSAYDDDSEGFGLFEPPSPAAFGYGRGGPLSSLGRSASSAQAFPFFPTRNQVLNEEREYKIVVQAPGVPLENLMLELVGGRRLEISASMSDGGEERRMLQTVHLARDADCSAISSAYKDGLLTVTVPKLSETDIAEKDPQDPEVSLIAAELEEHKSKMKDLVALLEVEQQSLRDAERKLLQAKRDSHIRRSQIRQDIAIGQEPRPQSVAVPEGEAQAEGGDAAPEPSSLDLEAGAQV
jgi:HSP20 family molecular chaperone IbpA